MGDILGGKKNNKIKVDFNLQWKTSHGLFPCEVLDVVQWMEGKQPEPGKGRGGGEQESLPELFSAKVASK